LSPRQAAALRQHITTIATLAAFTTTDKTLVADLCFIFFLNPQLQLGEQADHQPRRLRLKTRDFLPFPEGDIKYATFSSSSDRKLD
jgi:hypothetical protein